MAHHEKNNFYLDIIVVSHNGTPLKENDMKLYEALSKRIDEICKEKKSNICKLSLNGGMSPSNIYDIKKGRTTGTKIITIARFCDGAGITMEEFYRSPLFNDLDLEDEPEIKE